MHVPQSPGQLTQVSPMFASHIVLPHDEHWLQSIAQLVQFSPLFGSHVPLPQSAQGPQSTAHVVQLSPVGAEHIMSPQPAQFPQSAAQLLQSSPAPGLHVPSPHPAQTPQSCVHDEQSSPAIASHAPSLQPGQRPQSFAQFEQVSPPAESHALSPQPVQSPQSVSHVKHVSSPPQVPSPHSGAASGAPLPPSSPHPNKTRHATTSKRVVMAIRPSTCPSSGRRDRDQKNDAPIGLQLPTAGYDRGLQISDPSDVLSAKNVTATKTNPLSDREHLAAFREGRRDALERAYRQHVADITKFLRSGFMYTTNDTATRFPGVRDSFELESFVQETFARAFEERTRLAYDGLRPYGAFLNGIAKNLVLDRLRKQARHGEVLAAPDVIDALAVDEPAPAANEDEKRARELVTRFLDSECNDRDRTLYTLRYERDLSQVDAATAAGLTRIQVRRWESKFRARLLRYLKRADYVRDR